MDPLSQLTTALAGRYEIEREIGAGGMATVYLARDVKHSRRVALKLLKPELGAVLGVERFLSEIAVTANLQHPNLLPLFDSGEAAGLLFYVMPFVDGESLRARLEREKQLPVDEAVRIAVAIAGALDYAHQHGVIHRDLKPENILLQAGQPVIADFGIALAVSNAGGARVTQTGLSLGTPQYMSPEQATGDRAIDARTDIYSLAAMTYEMLTGEAPHTGTTAQAIIAKLMTEEVRSLSVLRRSVPPHVDAAVRHGLEKLAADRFATAGEFSLALTGARPYVATGMTGRFAREEQGASPPALPRRTRVLIGALALVALAGTLSAAWLATRSAPPAVLMRFPLGLPEGVRVFTGGGTKLAVTRDGRAIAIAGLSSGQMGIYLRRADDPVATLVRGTTQLPSGAGMNPEFSPDGEWIVFSGTDGLRKVPAIGGTPQTLTDAGGGGPSWGDAGEILYPRGNDLWIVSSEGRDERLVATPDTAAGFTRFRWPSVLPGGRYALVAMGRGIAGNVVDSLFLGVVSLRDGSVTDLGIQGTDPTYVRSGHLLFVRDGGLVFAAPFSLSDRKVTGPAVRILENTWLGTGGAGGYAVSDHGTLVSHSGGSGGSGLASELIVVSRTGVPRAIPGGEMPFWAPRVAPDGRRISVTLDQSIELSGSIAIIDPTTGARQRLTDVSGGQFGEWTRDGRRVVFVRGAPGGREFVSRAWDRSSADQVLGADSSRFVFELSIGPHNGLSALRGISGTNRNIYLAPTDTLGTMRVIVETPANERHPAISADGRWLAYTSDESGRDEIYAQPIPGPGPRLQISVNGGTEPLWSRTGTTIYFRGPQKIMSVPLGGSPLQVIRRDSLFVDSYTENVSSRFWDIFPDGQSFLMLKAPTRLEISTVDVLLNWTTLLDRSSSPAGAVRR
ncbi:MAG: protein kinase [Gemmatimonadaceae bacterium]